jgi:hypothetical protein
MTEPPGTGREGATVISEVGAALGATAAGGPDGADGADAVRVIGARQQPHLLWVHEHLEHLSEHAQAITGPATHVAEQRRQPWWR